MNKEKLHLLKGLAGNISSMADTGLSMLEGGVDYDVTESIRSQIGLLVLTFDATDEQCAEHYEELEEENEDGD